MIDLKTANGLDVRVPASSSDDISPKFGFTAGILKGALAEGWKRK